MKAYKGFDKNLQCRGFQYKIGCGYKVDKCKMCSYGFHTCQAPLKVWDFYPPVDGNRFCEVEQKGVVENTGANGKCVSTEIKIGEELGISELIGAHIEWCKRQTHSSETKSKDRCGTKIYSNSLYAKIGSDGYRATIHSNGCSATIGSSGDNATICSSGPTATIGSSGDFATISSSGGYATIGSCGDYAKICVTNDDNSIIGSSGNLATINCSGFAVKIDNSGRRANIYSSGNYTKIRCSGEDSIVVCTGNLSVVNAVIGTRVCLSEYKYDKTHAELVFAGMKAFRIDGKKYKPNTSYIMKNGKIMELEFAKRSLPGFLTFWK